MFWKICNAINNCGWLIILLHLFGWLTWYGIAHDIKLDIFCGGFLSGCVFAVMVYHIDNFVENLDDDD